MDLQLKGKTALVTGSASGIGYAIALGLAKEGASVYINSRTEETLRNAIQSIKSAVADASVDGIVADFSKVEEVNALIEQLPEIDILVNNVGVYGNQPFETTDDAHWFRDFEINVMSGVRLSRHYAPLMKAKNWGRIIFISSESAINIPEDMILYGVTKTAYLGLSRGLAKYLKGTNVTVNAVLPGPTLASATDKMFEEIAAAKNISVEEAPMAFIQEKRPSSIIQRFAKTEEVANMVVYVASPLSSATTGAALRVDGGVVDTAF
ncbi:SDR family oxidoreductase [Chryseobacterium gotjawalense]|uniref:SDR family oxidoreductase n=1 Tax=Chryseobacterium gotjawalense TaxID=3042315 RepID=A0ABY8RHM2_9FLAO|nr:SDR family oxidoreductase [Chryseobacterium sp. wdc7]WHF52763.1 SDR family oxidoreductase [Chryseobacterium sp. wdc7]